MTTHRLAHIDVLRVLNDAHNGAVRYRIHAHPFSDRTRVAEEVLRHHFIDNHHFRTVDSVLRCELASGHQRNVERLEVIGGDEGRVAFHLLVFARRVPFDGDSEHVPTS